MAHKEIFGTRDMSYSAWHRTDSMQRFVGLENAQNMHMIDMDAAAWVEFQPRTMLPLVLIETAMDKGQNHKTSTVTMKLAQMAGLPAYCLLYVVSDEMNPVDARYNDVVSFRCKRLTPDPTDVWRSFTPKGWAEALLAIRKRSAAELDKRISEGNQCLTTA